MTKSELKNWYGVEFRNKQRALLLDGRFYDSDGNIYAFLAYCEKNLTCNNRKLKNLDIMKVVDLTPYNIPSFLNNEFTPIWYWERKEPKTGRVTLENVEVGDEYFFTDVYGVVVSYTYSRSLNDEELIRGNPFGVYYTKQEALSARDDYMEYKKRKEEPCKWCAGYALSKNKYCLNCGRKLEVE